jgi:hypothetical protein
MTNATDKVLLNTQNPQTIATTNITYNYTNNNSSNYYYNSRTQAKQK